MFSRFFKVFQGNIGDYSMYGGRVEVMVGYPSLVLFVVSAPYYNILGWARVGKGRQG